MHLDARGKGGGWEAQARMPGKGEPRRKEGFDGRHGPQSVSSGVGCRRELIYLTNFRSPCLVLHSSILSQLSSGYTVGADGNRYVFGMNKERYPDFKAMNKKFHEAGIKVCPNIKPCE